jgi:predicted deacylase
MPRIDMLPIATLANGHRFELAVHEVRGAQDGPTLGVTAAIHGDEPLGVEIVRRLLAELDPGAMRGTVLAMPVVNPYAYQANTRNTPLDMSNLNRVFPGDPHGMLSEQLAHVVCDRFLPRLDYLVDLHSGGTYPTVDYVYIHDEGAELSYAFGQELLYRGTSYPGSLGQVARDRGIPCVVSELGGGQQREEHFIERGLRGIRNVMRSLGMVEGAVERPPRQLVMSELANMHPHQGGMLVSEVTVDQLGAGIPRGTVLGRVLSPLTFETLEVVEAPFEPSLVVLIRPGTTRIDPGDYMYMMGNGATAEEVTAG